MANNFDSNFTRILAKIFLPAFESERVLSKNVNTQLLSGKFNPDTGDNYDFKRPTDYRSVRTSDGDLTGQTKSSIITGKATGTVQDYFSVEVDYLEAEEATKMGQLDQLLRPMATRIKTDLELDFASYMMKNSGLLAGVVGTPVSKWDHVALAGATLEASGVPHDKRWCYTLNPYTQRSLASDQRSLGAGGSAGNEIVEAHRRATITEEFAGMRVMTGTTLDSYSMPATGGDLVGALSATPVATYVSVKDTLQQTWAITGIGSFTGTIPAGSTITVTGRNRLNLSTRQPMIDETGANVSFTAVVTVDATLTGGAGSVVVSGAAIFEANGQYNTVDSALTSGDVITIGGAASTLYQPNLFWHPDAFAIGSVPMKKLYATDTIATTEDGLQFRVTRYADGRANTQNVRFDFRPAYGVMNPFFAGQGFGEA